MILHAKKWKVTVCCCFIHRTIGWINLFSSNSLNCGTASIVRGRYSTSQIVLNFPWESYLNQGSKKRLYIYLHICQIFQLPKKSPNKNIKTRKKYLYHLGNFNSPLVDKPLPWDRPRVKYCLRCSFWLLAVFRHFPPSSVCPGFSQFRNILVFCAILLQYVAFKASIKHN